MPELDIFEAGVTAPHQLTLPSISGFNHIPVKLAGASSATLPDEEPFNFNVMLLSPTM